MNLQEFIDKKTSKIASSAFPINLFFLKQTASKKPENFFDIKKATLRQDADKHFKNLLKSTLSKLSSHLAENEIGDFFNESHNGASVLSILEVDKLVKFTEEIRKFDSIPKVSDEKAVKKIHAHAYKLELDDESEIIFFTKVPQGGKIKSKYAMLKGGYFDLIEDMLLIYADRVDCVYFSDRDGLLVLNKPAMETIFKFDEYYRQKTKQVCENKIQNKLVNAPEELYDAINESPQITKKVTRMDKEKKFDISVGELRKYMESLEENKDRFTDQFKNYRSLQEEGGLYIIENKEEFNVFLNACDKSVEIPLEQKDEIEPDIYLNTSPIKMTG